MKSLADLPVLLDTLVPNEHMHVSTVPHVRPIMHLQDVWVGSIVNTYKVCGQTSTWLQPLLHCRHEHPTHPLQIFESNLAPAMICICESSIRYQILMSH
jgi:hypothetical protein